MPYLVLETLDNVSAQPRMKSIVESSIGVFRGVDKMILKSQSLLKNIFVVEMSFIREKNTFCNIIICMVWEACLGYLSVGTKKSGRNDGCDSALPCLAQEIL